MKHQLDESLASPQDLKAVVAEVREYAKWFSHNSVKKRLHAGGHDQPPVISRAAAALIRSSGGTKPPTQQSIDKLIEDLKDFEASAPLVSVTLAAPAAGGTKKTITAWCRQNIEPNVLVDFDFNSTLLGGMVVRYGSHLYDWSFRRQILANKDKFPEVLRRV